MVLPKNRRLLAMYADEGRRGYLAPIVKDVPREDILRKILDETKLPLKQLLRKKKPVLTNK